MENLATLYGTVEDRELWAKYENNHKNGQNNLNEEEDLIVLN